MKPRLFIASSTEALPIAIGIQTNLQRTTEVTVWSQGLFRAGDTPLSSLVKQAEEFDFGLFLMSPEDLVRIRGEEHTAARDNVVFELGLFVGKLGADRCFVLVPQDLKGFRIPADLLGVIPLEYEVERSDGNWEAATGPACAKLQTRVVQVGPREVAPQIAAGREAEEVDRTTPRAETAEREEQGQGGPDLYRWMHSYMKKEWDQALKEVDIAIGAAPADEKLNLGCWRARVLENRSPGEGRLVLRNLIAEHPERSEPYVHLSLVHSDAGRYADALSVLDEGLARGQSPALDYNKARILRDLNRKDEAISHLRRAFELDPSRSWVADELVQMLMDSGETAEARRVLDRALLIQPEDVVLLRRYAQVLERQLGPAAALDPMTKLTRLRPDSSQFLTLRGNLYLSLELNNAAMRDYRAATALAEDKEAWILANIGNLLKNRGFYDEAITYLERAIAIEPDSQYAHDRLAGALKARAEEDEVIAEKLREGRRLLNPPAMPALDPQLIAALLNRPTADST